MTNDEATEKLSRIQRRLAGDRASIEARIAGHPEICAMVQGSRRTFGEVRLSGPFFDRPEPEWTRWPSVKLSEMAPLPAKGDSREVQTARSRR
jgi:hypothetical protein